MTRDFEFEIDGKDYRLDDCKQYFELWRCYHPDNDDPRDFFWIRDMPIAEGKRFIKLSDNEKKVLINRWRRIQRK